MKMPRQKNATASFRFSDETKRDLEWAAKAQHIAQTNVVELAIQAYVRALRKEMGQEQPDQVDRPERQPDQH